MLLTDYLFMKEEAACKENPETHEEGENKAVMVGLSIVLGLTMLIGGMLILLANGVPLGFMLPNIKEEATLSTIVFTVTVLVAALYILYAGLKELIVERRFSVEFLMAIAALGALALQAYFEAATVLFLYTIAEYLEGYIETRARRTVEKLSKLMPEKARVLLNGQEKNMDISEVDPGMTILVRPGERIPLDGNVMEGFSHVEQAIVTGESLPVPKKINDCVYAGTLNTSGVLKIAVTKKASETLVSRIIQLVIESSKHKASIERLVDRFAKVYVPIVII
jgi:Cd2+/Zn2+-exporting ATPase